MASDDMSREPRAPGDPEEVRIITADEIAEAEQLSSMWKFGLPIERQ